ncbi:MAG: CHASE3 domain-containing protein [Chthoniobacterales bacterium]
MREQNKLLVLFVVMAVVLTASLMVGYAYGVKTLQIKNQVQIHSRVLQQLADVRSTIDDAETGQRGYLLTRKQTYLKPYETSLLTLPKEMDKLKEWAMRNELSLDQVLRLEKLCYQKLNELKASISLEQKDQHDAALDLVQSDHGKQVMDEIRLCMGELIQEETAGLNLSSEAAVHTVRYRDYVFVSVAIVNLIFLFWVYGRLRQEIEHSNKALLELQRQKDLLAVTLASIGDAVILTDVSSRITYLNKVAEDLTGWTSAEAIGQSCENIFQIINEDSREVVESLVSKVLATGIIVGLANHTLLIRKDGSEIPIDDSGAPIREPNGILRGVVLVFRDFSDYKNSEKDLRKAKTDLEVASKSKDEFLAALSHELRTPLTPVLATLIHWEKKEVLPPALRPDLLMLRRNIELEARLIDDLLDLTKIVHGKFPLIRKPMDIHDSIRSVTSIFKHELDTKNIRLTLSLDAAHHHVTGDSARLQQVLWNVLGNAVKFTSPQGNISITSSNSEKGIIEVHISDDGIGMSAATLNKLFAPFKQGEAHLPNQGGLGLGMAISKNIIEAHDGEIIATSEGLRKGSEFSMKLPWITSVDEEPKKALTQSVPLLSGLQILLVEDHNDTAQALCLLLVEQGHTVKIAHRVSDALKTLHEDKFDLVLSDIGLPDATGIDLILEARKFWHGPAIAMTGYGMAEDIQKCRHAGYNAHLAKPFSPDQLESAILSLISPEEKNA